MPAWWEFPAQSIQDDEPAGPIERQASLAGGSWAGIAGTRVDSSSRQYGMFAADSRRRQGWVLRIGAALLTLILAGGWIGRGGPVRHDTAGDAFWKIGSARVDRGSRGALDRSGRDAVADVGSPGGGLRAGAIARPVPDPAHGTSRERCLCSGTGR